MIAMAWVSAPNSDEGVGGMGASPPIHAPRRAHVPAHVSRHHAMHCLPTRTARRSARSRPLASSVRVWKRSRAAATDMVTSGGGGDEHCRPTFAELTNLFNPRLCYSWWSSTGRPRETQVGPCVGGVDQPQRVVLSQQRKPD